MKSSNYQARESKRIGLNTALETATDQDAQKRAREIRRENFRRAKTGNGSASGWF